MLYCPFLKVPSTDALIFRFQQNIGEISWHYLLFKQLNSFLICLCSQSLFTLSLIEDYLAKRIVAGTEETWVRNRNYFRKIFLFYNFALVFDYIYTLNKQFICIGFEFFYIMCVCVCVRAFLYIYIYLFICLFNLSVWGCLYEQDLMAVHLELTEKNW